MGGLLAGFVLAQPWADLVLSGAATVEQLRSNLSALQVPWDEQAAARRGTLAEPAPAYWTARSQLPWN